MRSHPDRLRSGSTTRELREQRSWTQGQLAEAAGISQPAVARFEAGGTVHSSNGWRGRSAWSWS
ncbi:helix-turn-helix domain-containing protein [Saccharopolyspora kobensis]|uniref:helix-turn-helix domain-containing protein n=1 Tax=Saccharopolyspora kobensis TaxID=146035 RepID=UPI001F3CEA18|nr:helix-turn-helix transcriptional regulator [Saccharopolyspora kobensis]